MHDLQEGFFFFNSKEELDCNQSFYTFHIYNGKFSILNFQQCCTVADYHFRT